MENVNERASFYPKTRKQWRSWLEKNGEKKASVWLIIYHKNSTTPGVHYAEAVEEGLCFGWIDSTRKTIDDERFIQFFCKRKHNSIWSKINKLKVERLIQEGLMEPAGYKSIEIAKQNGSWTILDEVEELVIPPDLEKAFQNTNKPTLNTAGDVDRSPPYKFNR